MLGRISIRNARKQFTEYSLFVVTMIVCVSLMYTYNSLIFSDNVVSLLSSASSSGGEALLFLVGLITLLIILILGWFVSYMLIFMLRKRSEELAIYMFLGIERKRITGLFMTENLVIGFASLLIGLFFGVFVSELLEVAVAAMLSNSYHMSFGFSIPGAVLTVVCFALIYMLALHFGNRKLKKSELIELMNYEQVNQQVYIKNSIIGVLIFLLSIIIGGFSLYLFICTPIGQGFDILIGTVLAVLCIFCFFNGVVPLATSILGESTKWKYSKLHLFVLKEFITKINQRTTLLAGLATVMTFSAVLFGLAVSMGLLVKEAAKLEAYDITIIHFDEVYNFEEYKEYLDNSGLIYNSHDYTLYNNGNREMQGVRNTVLAAYLDDTGSILPPESYIYAENQFDMYIRYSDYIALRNLMGLTPIEMDSQSFLIHCMPYLEDAYSSYMDLNKELTINDITLQYSGIHTEPFNQYGGYGNGQEYLIVLPDDVIADMSVSYSLMVANMETEGNNQIINRMIAAIAHLYNIPSGGLYSYDEEYVTIIPKDLSNQDFISGSSITLSSGPDITTVIPIMYLAFVFAIISVVVIAVQLLHENTEQRNRYEMLRILGTDSDNIKKALRHSTYIFFILPMIPTLLLGGAIVYCIAIKACTQYFYVPVMSEIQFFALTSSIIVWGVIIAIFVVYALIAFSTLKRNLLRISTEDIYLTDS